MTRAIVTVIVTAPAWVSVLWLWHVASAAGL